MFRMIIIFLLIFVIILCILIYIGRPCGVDERPAGVIDLDVALNTIDHRARLHPITKEPAKQHAFRVGVAARGTIVEGSIRISYASAPMIER